MSRTSSRSGLNKLSAIQGNLKLMKKDTKKFQTISSKTLRRQNLAIETIKRENESLKDQIITLTRAHNTNRSVILENQIRKLNEQADILSRKLEEEMQKVYDYEEQLHNLDQRILESRRVMGSIHIAKEHRSLIERQIAVLEDRLDNGLKKYNKALAYNKYLREQINTLRQERLIFDSIYKKMEKELHDQKEQMAEIIEQSNAFYEERDAATHNLASLKVLADKVFAELDEKMNILNEIIQKDEELNKRLKFESSLRQGIMISQEETDKRRKSAGLQKAETKEKLQQVRDRIRLLKEQFMKITQATGKDPEQLIVDFAASEEKNFSLFTYANEQTNEIEKIQQQIIQLEDQIKEAKEDGQNGDSKRKKLLADLELQLEQITMQSNTFEKKHKETMRILNSLKVNIERIFTACSCDEKAISNLLGTTGVTESNMLVYLGVVEQRAAELLAQYARIKEKLAEKDAKLFTQIGPQHPVGNTTLSIVPPTTAESESEDDESEEERPLSKEELRARSIKLITQTKTKKKTKKATPPVRPHTSGKKKRGDSTQSLQERPSSH